MPNNLWLFFWGGAHVYIQLPRSGFVFGRLFLCYAAPETSFCLVGPVFRPSVMVPCQMYIFRFARILNGFWWNLRELITTTNRLNDYILGEIETGTREIYITREKIRTDVNRFRRDVKQVLTPSEWSDKFHCADDGRHGNVGTETFTTKLNGCRQMQQRRHHMTECGLYLSS